LKKYVATASSWQVPGKLDIPWPMKYFLSLCLIIGCQVAAASESELSRQMSGQEAFALFHRSVFQMKLDLKAFLHNGRNEIAKIRKSSALNSMCLKGRDSKKCELALLEAAPYSVFVVQDRNIFQLDEDLKTKYKFDVETGMRVFQLSTGLRWMARKDVYNGVPVPKEANRKTYARFLTQIEEFHKLKSLELRKAEPMIPPPAKRLINVIESTDTVDLMSDEEFVD
jgi:hypothetical protein